MPTVGGTCAAYARVSPSLEAVIVETLVRENYALRENSSPVVYAAFATR